MTGKEFLKSIENEHFIKRDELCSDYAINNKSSLNNFKPITIKDSKNELTYLVSNDYLKFDNILIPLSAPRAQKVMDSSYCILPTKKMVEQIWQNAEIKIPQYPKGPPYDSSMYSVKAILGISDKIEKFMIGKDNTKLLAGHKKDVVLTNKLSPNNPNKRVAIYGWHGTNGVAIQGPGPNYSSHERDYFYDYSHGIRLISRDCTLNGQILDILDVLTGDNAYLLSDEGKLTFIRY